MNGTLDILRKGVTKLDFGSMDWRQIAKLIRPFEALFLKFGQKAIDDVVILEHAFHRCLDSGGEGSFGVARAAAERLSDLAHGLDATDHFQVIVDLQRRFQTLNYRTDGLGEAFLAAMKESKQASREKIAQELLKNPARVKKLEELNEAANETLAKLGEALAAAQHADPPLPISKIWAHFNQVVPLNSSPMQTAITYAAANVKGINDALNLPTLEKQLWALRGFMSKIRGELGEGYALLNPTWLKQKDELLKEAEKIAEEMGDGYTAHYITQLDNNIMLNKLEGPDAMIVIVHPTKGDMHIYSRIQVKTAKVSEGAEQTAVDTVREIGFEKQLAKDNPQAIAHCSVTWGDKTREFTIQDHSRVSAQHFLINAKGGRLRKKDIDFLQSLSGTPVKELMLDMSVDQFTLLAIEIMEAALKANPTKP